MRVPMLIMSTRCFRSNTVAIRPENIPDRTVATSGVCVEWFTLDRNRGMRPSEAMAYSTLGRGNMAPRREVERPKSAPMVTTVPTKFHPTAWKACGKGESESCR